MTAITITTVRAELQLVIADADPIALGKIDIPIEAATHVDSHGELMLRPVTSVSDVRDFVQQVFQRNLTADPELRYTQNGLPVANFHRREHPAHL